MKLENLQFSIQKKIKRKKKYKLDLESKLDSLKSLNISEESSQYKKVHEDLKKYMMK